MPELSGTISGSIKSVALVVPCNIKWFSLWNRTGGSITVNVGLTISGTDRYFKSVILPAWTSTDELVNIRVLAGCQIIVSASGNCDYIFTLSGD